MLENKKNVLLLFSCIIVAKFYQVNAEGDSQNKNTGGSFHKTGTTGVSTLTRSTRGYLAEPDTLYIVSIL